ncbi:flavonoid 3'-monooxygenase CYP75B137 [Manihot esculenta]|uniref:Cytochrome P450 n=1 Tax=Manihot esculenta TaxID=3983 RepID=A0A2C9WJY8_MANES|nr:flavonoid 3'-monooxygenase CYP75B137 [Manihot esculenta]OAY59955.1 hypothetical protein MANES_01G074200v8 [Manihot esculenta]
MFEFFSGLWSSSCSKERENFWLTISVSAILILWFCSNLRKSKKRIPPLPPGPRGLPVVGYLPFLDTELHKQFTELAGVYGPIYKLWLGKKLCVVVSSNSAAKEVLRDQDAIVGNRDPPVVAQIISYGVLDIAWSSLGPAWKKMRKIFAREMLSNSNLETLSSLRKQEVKKTVRNTYNNTGKPVDIGELAFLVSINTMTNMLWGSIHEGDDTHNDGKQFKKLMAGLMVLLGKPNISDFFPMLAALDLQGMQKQARKFVQSFDNFINPIIERGQKLVEANQGRTTAEKDKQRKDFLILLLELKEQHENTETSFSMNEIKSLLTDVVVGGSDTTSTVVEWVFAELMHNQEMMEKVHQELDEVVGLNNCVEEFHLPRLSYLDAVVKETLRLHPPLPLLVPRRPSQSCSIGGYTIPKGSAIFLNVYAIHRDPNLWDNPLEFRPERFLNEDSTTKFDYSGNNFQFFPFGSGRRICAGLPLAEKMLMYQLASLLHSFEWKLPNNTKLELSDKYGIVVKVLKPVVVIPTPRLSNLDMY